VKKIAFGLAGLLVVLWPPMDSAAGTVASLQWYAGDTTTPYSVVVTEVVEEGMMVRKLTISLDGRTAFSFSDLDHFLGMAPTSDDGGLLVTYWIGGSAYHVRVLAKTAQGIALVLEDGSKRMPEVLQTEPYPTILLSDMASGDKTMRTYKWTGSEFKKMKPVVRKKLLDGLK
jgi:hypothetical protein